MNDFWTKNRSSQCTCKNDKKWCYTVDRLRASFWCIVIGCGRMLRWCKTLSLNPLEILVSNNFVLHNINYIKVINYIFLVIVFMTWNCVLKRQGSNRARNNFCPREVAKPRVNSISHRHKCLKQLQKCEPILPDCTGCQYFEEWAFVFV